MADCSADAAPALQHWLRALPAGTTVVPPSGACYRLDEGITLRDPDGLTVDGGRYQDDEGPGAVIGRKGTAAFTVVGGTGVTFEGMAIVGTDPGGYKPKLAFAGGIQLEGTSDAVIRSDSITGTYGDGITLDPLRGGADHNSGRIVAPTTSVAIRDVTVQGAGRQGITFASVQGATVSDVVVDDVGLDTFDLEADQGDEGARDVDIDGCQASGGALFFANAGVGDGRSTGAITVTGCTMLRPEGGDAVLVQDHGNGAVPRGPYDFVDDTFWCGASAYVACLQLTHAVVTLRDCTLRFPRSTVHEAVYHAAAGSTLTLDDDVASGYGRTGGGGGVVHVSGGQWTPAGVKSAANANGSRT